ncbi:hypothetical protein Tco_0309364 [Tanacetum coccineum]
MGDENPICTLGDYSKPSHEGYRNTIELPIGKNVVPLQSDIIRLVQNECTFHGLWFEDQNQHLKDFLKLLDSLDLDESLSKAWTRFKDLLQKVPHHGLDLWLQVQIFYDHVDNTIQKSIDYAAGERLYKLRPHKAWAAIERLAQYENEGWNDAFVPEDVSLNYKSPDIEQLLGIMEHKVNMLMKDAISLMGKSESIFRLATNKIQLEDYMQAITGEFMEFSLEVTQRLQERIKESENKPKKIIKITRYDPLVKGVTFRLGGVEIEMSLLEFGWRVGLYSERESREVATLSGLRGALTVNSNRLNHLFWPSIGDDRYNVGNKKVKSIRDLRIRLAHRCITMTITGRKETTNRVTKIDLFYLYCIFGEGIVCNIPYWLTKYLKGVREKSVIFRGMFVTKIARSFGLLTEEMVNVLSREPPPYIYKKTLLIKIGVIIELHEGVCYWSSTRGVVEEGKGDDEEGDEEGETEELEVLRMFTET